MQRTLLPLAVLLCFALSAAAEAPPQPAALLFGQLAKTPLATRTKVARLIVERYPTLTNEVAALLSKARPTFMREIYPELAALIERDYPELPALLGRELVSRREITVAIDQMVRTRYPRLIAELRALPDAPDRTGQAMALIRTRYPGLFGDLVALLQRKFPSVLTSIQKVIETKAPGLLVDVGGVVLARYPELAGRIYGETLAGYPALPGEILAILAEPPPAPAPEPPAPSAPQPSAP